MMNRWFVGKDMLPPPPHAEEGPACVCVLIWSVCIAYYSVHCSNTHGTEIANTLVWMLLNLGIADKGKK